jgi:hypothetical protein
VSEHVTLKIDQGALQQLHQGLAAGVGALAEAVADTAPHPLIRRRVVERPSASGVVFVEVIFDEPAAFVEYGTPAHDIVAKHKALKIGDKFVSGKVHHPGGKPEPFITPAFIAAVDQAEGHIRRGVATRYR